jgi:cell division protein FtsB
MNNGVLDNHAIPAGAIRGFARYAAPVRNPSDVSEMQAELDHLCAENHCLRAENRRLQRALDDRAFRAALEAKPRQVSEMTAGTGQGPP